MTITYDDPRIDKIAQRTCSRLSLCQGYADDLAQHTRIKLWRNSGTESATTLSWVYTAMYNAAVDLLRKNARYSPLEDFSYSPGFVSSPEDEMVAQERADVVSAALGGLSDKHREAVILTQMDGNSHKSVAEKLGIPEGTVHTRVHYALRKLRDDETLASLVA